MVYVALLRGINVGGKTKVEMPKLKAFFESLGCSDVSTYINSGNVVFKDERTIKELEPLIEAGIEKSFGLKIRVVLRDSQNIKKLCAEIPKDWTNDKQQKTDVMFLWDEIDDEDILNKVKINPDIEKALYIDGALIWNIGRENVTRGGGVKLIKTDFYKHMTARNINTVRKLNELMRQEP
jgi:uncharacterized protein (DUF1697 family)